MNWLINILERFEVFGFENRTFGAPRSSQWGSFRNEFLKKHPYCEACGVKAETAHHIKSFARNPELELSESNLCALCDECHLVLAHLKSFKRLDEDIRNVVKLFRAKVEKQRNI